MKKKVFLLALLLLGITLLKAQTRNVDLILFMGQSNMAGRGVVTNEHPETAPIVLPGAGFEFRAVSDTTRLYPIAEPFGRYENREGGIWEPEKKTGSLVTAFVNAYYEQCHVPVIAVSASRGGSRISQWQPDQPFFADVRRRLQSAQRYLSDHQITVSHTYMVWLQGESDGDGKTPAEDYKARFVTMWQELQTLGVERCFLIRIGDYNGSKAIDYSYIQQVQDDICQSVPGVTMVATELNTFRAAGYMKDDFHFYQDGYNRIGTLAGTVTASSRDVEPSCTPDNTVCTSRLSLDGQWQFRVSAGQNSGKWSKITVPSCWEQEGFGNYTYGRYYLYNDSASTETAIYRRTFKVPHDWQGQNIRLVFQGVMTDAEVLVNGQLAGPIHQGGFTQFSYDVTPLLKAKGNNQIEVRVSKQSANASVNQAERRADWWLFGGIYRPVYLEAKPQQHIVRVAIDARADGTLSEEVYLQGADLSQQVRISLLSLQGNLLSQSIHAVDDTTLLHISTHYPGIVTWNPERPALYQLRTDLLSAQGEVLHSTTERIGFRTIEVRPHDGIYLNGTKLLVKGTNRHCFTPEGGRTLTPSQSLEDIRLIKQMNMNAIRSHYPPDEHFLSLCDSLGLLYLDELPGWQWSYDDSTAHRMLSEMLPRDVNHPCIFVWSNGNEGGWNTSIDTLFAQYDPQHRPVVHPWARFGDINTRHYPSYQNLLSILNMRDDIYMPTEFLHGLYDRGQGAGLEEYWQTATQYPLFAGGFLWAFVDEAIARTDRGGELDSYGPNGPDGVVGPHREKEGSFYTIREVWSPVHVRDFVMSKGFDGNFSVENRYLFTSLDETTMTWQLQKCPLNDSMQKLASGLVQLPAIKPGETGLAHMALPTNWQEADVLQLEAYNALGDTIYTWSVPVKSPEQYLQSIASTETNALHASVVEEDSAYVLKANGRAARFSRRDCQLISLENNGKLSPLTNGPVPVGFKMAYLDSYTRMQGDTAQLVVQYQGGADSIVWSMSPDGRLCMDALILNRKKGKGFEGEFLDQPLYQLGFSFDYPEAAVSGIDWMGDGPYRVWKNRLRGARLGLWHKDYNNTVTGEYYYPLIYPEFKGYHANMYWARLLSSDKTSKGLSLFSATSHLYLRLYTPEESRNVQDRGETYVPFPTGDISFLLEIPGMKTSKSLSVLGPNSQAASLSLKSFEKGYRIKVWLDM